MIRETRAAEAVTEVAYAALSAPFGTDALPSLLSVVQGLFGADIAGFYIHDWQGLTVPVCITPNDAWQSLPFTEMPTRLAAFAHPGIHHLVVALPSQPFTVTDLVSEHAWLESQMAREMSPYWGRQFHFAIPVPQSAVPHGTSQAWVFGRGRSSMSAADRQLADAISPVLTAVARHRNAISALEDQLTVGDLLTQRELLVLTLQSQGLGAQEISSQLGMSPRTAQKHTEHIYRKLGVHNRQDALHAWSLLNTP